MLDRVHKVQHLEIIRFSFPGFINIKHQDLIRILESTRKIIKQGLMSGNRYAAARLPGYIGLDKRLLAADKVARISVGW